MCDVSSAQDMLSGPFRRCRRRVWPVLLVAVAVLLAVLLLLDRRHQQQQPKRPVRAKHIFRAGQEEYVDGKGVRVVVGRYVGNQARQVANATGEMLNSNNYAPDWRAGRDGDPVVIEPKDLLKMQQYFQINRFNLLASDRIPLNRTLPDVRRKKCQYLYRDFRGYPKSSIIIVFHNEAWSTLLRTVWSVINRSPRELLEEIILVDDASDRDFLKKPLDEYISTLPVRTILLRTHERIGLVLARLRGAKIAKGDVLTFLDAHCECTNGWLESLVARIAEDRKTVVCPVIDIISDDTFAYVKSFELHWGAFNWNLQFRWFTLSGRELQKRKRDTTQPFFTPAMAGGLFAMDRDYFFQLGSYDEDMRIWGGENLELSFRVWQCGGKIEIVPCSHVGHLFRKSSPYTFPGGIWNTLYSNLARVALVWMDDWGEFYFKFNEQARQVRDGLNVTARLELRKSLGCESFGWYLDNVWPQHFFPKPDRFFGRIRNIGVGKCLTKPIGKSTSNQPMGVATIGDCLGGDQAVEMFVMTRDGFVMTDDSVCLDAPEKATNGFSKVRIVACSGFSRQKWKYDEQTRNLVHVSNEKCLDVPPEKNGSDGLVIRECGSGKTQKWSMEAVSWTPNR